MEITQRIATLDDATTLLTWRNHPRAREYSLHNEEIPSPEHLQWLKARLQRVHLEPFFLFEMDGKPIGMSRLDDLNISSNEFEISILVDPNEQGRGAGLKILNITCDIFFEKYPNHKINARVHKENLVSQKLFNRAGFALTPSVGSFLNFEKNL